MLLSRLLSFILRGLQFITAIIVVGLVGHMIWRRETTGQGPRGRFIYTEVVGAISALISLVFLLPFSATMMHYPLDFIFSLSWFAAFGALMQWVSQDNFTCTGVFGVWFWDGFTHDYYCTEYKTIEGFAAISGILWLFSAFIGIHVYHRVRGRTTKQNGHAYA